MDWGTLLQGIGTLITALVAIMTYRKASATHELVNGVSHDLATAQIGQAHAEGVLAGQSAEREHT